MSYFKDKRFQGYHLGLGHATLEIKSYLKCWWHILLSLLMYFCVKWEMLGWAPSRMPWSPKTGMQRCSKTKLRPGTIYQNFNISQRCLNVVLQVPREECNQVPRQECRQVPRSYTTTESDQECSTVTRPVCRPVPRNQCRDEQQQVSSLVPKQKCYSKPKQVKK